ncbi:MAG TPA: TIGR03013 family XrtA/PEP-CTERM system glycosyltransferase [Steroidobacteraceae bacterium]|nr:TIGR03013 family XrtA/PEP-CTERM system glycosyltransferase [Steroidobacteraceae bacterium]
MFIFRQYLRLQCIIVMMIEAVAFCAAPFLAAHLLARTFRDVLLILSAGWWPAALLFTGVMMTGLLSMGLYCARQRARFDGIVIRICIASVGTFVALCLVFSFAAPHPMSRSLLALTTLLAFTASVITRAAMEKIGDDDRFKRRVLVYGSGQHAMSISRLRRRSDQRAFVIVGFVPPAGVPPPGSAPSDLSDRLLPADEPLLSLCRRLNVDEIVLAMDDRRREFPVQELLECRMSGYEVIELSTFFERETGKVRVDVLNPSWMIFGDGFNRSSARRLTERGFDFLASVILAALTCPIVVLIALAIKIEDGWRAPIFYFQTRVGFENKLFKLIKFRSMRVDAEMDGTPRWAAPSDPRITRVGMVLRKLRLDELPQIFNVLVGDMRFVGPRPERPHFVDSLNTQIPYYRERHFVKPGITGWAQLCYSYGASLNDATEKLQYDLYYIKNQSLMFDFIILLATLEVVFLGKGAR